MELLSENSQDKTKRSQEGEGPVGVDHGETLVQLMEAPEFKKLTSASGSCSVENSVEEIEVKSDGEGREDHEAEKSSINKRQHQQHDDLQQVEERGGKEGGVHNLSWVKRRKRNLESRRKAIDNFEEEMTIFVWDYLSANYGEKFPSAESLYEFSVKTVREKILQPEVSSYYSKVIEHGGSWTQFQLNPARQENVQRFLEEMM